MLSNLERETVIESPTSSTVKSSKSPRDEDSAIEKGVRRIGATHCTRAAIQFLSIVQGSAIPFPAQVRH